MSTRSELSRGREYDDETGRPGWFVGTDREPNLYRLVDQVHRGGEGVVWRAARTDGEPGVYWAVKILLGRHLGRGDDETVQQSLDRWERIWDGTIERTALLHDIRGIVPAIRVFQGPTPAPADRVRVSATRTLCLVTPWIDGQDLHDWSKAQRRGLDAVVGVLEDLCGLVDQLAERGNVHRDISPRNIMIDNSARVVLIDFAFMRQAGADPTHLVYKRGFSAPEQAITPATDRYSVGAVAYQLLTGVLPPVADAAVQARRGLAEWGYPPAIAEHVASLLHADPARRPGRLVPWAEQLRTLAAAGQQVEGYTAVALAVGATGATELAAAGLTVSTGQLTPHLHLTLHTEVHGPMHTSTVSAARRGNGDVALFAADHAGELWVRVGLRWRRVGEVGMGGELHAAAHGDGSVSGYFRREDGRLAAVVIAPTGEVRIHGVATHVRRLLAAAPGATGVPVIAAEDTFGSVVCGDPDGPTDTGLRDVIASAVTTNTWGELVCVGLSAAGQFAVVETINGEWDQADWRDDAPAGAVNVACVGHRGGLALAVATGSGSFVRSDLGRDWTCLVTEPASRVALAMGAGWRLQFATLAQRRVYFAEEGTPGVWPAHATETR